MKRFRPGLQRSTRMTVLTCMGFLAVMAGILLFLTAFPIVREERQAVLVTQQKDEETQTCTAVEFAWEEVPQTLSTWSAGVDGFSRSIDEFTETASTAAVPETTAETTTAT